MGTIDIEKEPCTVQSCIRSKVVRDFRFQMTCQIDSPKSRVMMVVTSERIKMLKDLACGSQQSEGWCYLSINHKAVRRILYSSENFGS